MTHKHTKLPQFENPRGLFGLFLIIIFSFLISGWFKRKEEALSKKRGTRHPAARFFSTYLHIEGFIYGIAAIVGFIILLIKSKK
tara:strand:+ start:18 stop:269 length:252 start_codon:yes stop_codon:yes gene_type:complete